MNDFPKLPIFRRPCTVYVGSIVTSIIGKAEVSNLLRKIGFRVCFYSKETNVISMFCLCSRFNLYTSLKLLEKNRLKYEFCKKSLRKDEPLTSWTLFWAYLSSLLGGFAVVPSGFAVVPTQKWWQTCSKKCSTGQRFIFLKWLLTKSIL